MAVLFSFGLLAGLLGGRRYGKQHAERRAGARGADDVDAAAGLRDDAVHRLQADARCLAPGPSW